MEEEAAKEQENLDNKPTLPASAVSDPERKLFRLVRSSGGTLSKGGFGIHVPISSVTMIEEEKAPQKKMDKLEGSRNTSTDQSEASREKDIETNVSNDQSTRISWHLFLEEVIYLHERGLLEAYDTNEQRLDSYHLYKLLPDHDIPLAVFLVYAHLKQQTYKVVRFSRERRNIILQQQQQKEQKQQLPGGKENGQRTPLPFLLREASARAKLPPFHSIDCELAWDVYPPNTTYQKRDPGLPAFSVLVTSHTRPFHFDRIRALLQENDPVRIKLATVSESGTVVLFGVTDIGAPNIAPNQSENNKIDAPQQQDLS